MSLPGTRKKALTWMYATSRERRTRLSVENCRRFIPKKRTDLVKISIVPWAAFNKILKWLGCPIYTSWYDLYNGILLFSRLVRVVKQWFTSRTDSWWTAYHYCELGCIIKPMTRKTRIGRETIDYELYSAVLRIVGEYVPLKIEFRIY